MRRTLGAGVGVHGDDLGRGDDLEAAGVADLVGPADEHDGNAELLGGLPGAATISAGALSPPMASTAMGSIGWGSWVARLRSLRTRGPAQSTSMAWRPWYQPQLPHTTWGTWPTPHRGHMLRAGVDESPGRSPAAAALGLRGLLLGDGHGGYLGRGWDGRDRPVGHGGRERASGRGDPGRTNAENRSGVSRRTEGRRGRPSGGRAAARRPRRSAPVAAPSTVAGKRSGRGPGSRAAQRRQRQGEQHGVAHQRLEVDVLAGERPGLALGRVALEDLARPGPRPRPSTGLEAAAALALPLGATTVPSTIDAARSAPRARGRRRRAGPRATSDDGRAPGRRADRRAGPPAGCRGVAGGRRRGRRAACGGHEQVLIADASGRGPGRRTPRPSGRRAPVRGRAARRPSEHDGPGPAASRGRP